MLTRDQEKLRLPRLRPVGIPRTLALARRNPVRLADEAHALVVVGLGPLPTTLLREQGERLLILDDRLVHQDRRIFSLRQRQRETNLPTQRITHETSRGPQHQALAQVRRLRITHYKQTPNFNKKYNTLFQKNRNQKKMRPHIISRRSRCGADELGQEQ